MKTIKTRGIKLPHTNNNYQENIFLHSFETEKNPWVLILFSHAIV